MRCTFLSPCLFIPLSLCLCICLTCPWFLSSYWLFSYLVCLLRSALLMGLYHAWEPGARDEARASGSRSTELTDAYPHTSTGQPAGTCLSDISYLYSATHMYRDMYVSIPRSICVYMFLHACARACVCVRVCVDVCMHVRVHACVYARVLCMHAHTRTRVCLCVHVLALERR